MTSHFLAPYTGTPEVFFEIGEWEEGMDIINELSIQYTGMQKQSHQLSVRS